jgi:hypothetical protein
MADLYIELDLDPIEKIVRMTCSGALLSSPGYPLIWATESLSSAEMQRANVTTSP